MKKTVVINVVGLTKRLVGEHTPFIKNFLERGRYSKIKPVVPAVTCTAQSTYLTGELPSVHGIVANGWYFKEECEVKFWRQSNKLVEAPKIWQVLKAEDPKFTCCNMFWWYNMYSSVDYSVTPRPNYLADGRKIPDCYTHPPSLRDELQKELGTFPLFHFWGPKTSIKSSRWIADAAIATDKKYNATLTLVYLPHLDYNLQRHGTDMVQISNDLAEVDHEVKKLVEYFENQGASIILLSEYGITDVDNPIHLNRILRKEGYLAIRKERGLELLDAGASDVFAVADHQIAHIYIKNKTNISKVKEVLLGTMGVEHVLDKKQQKEVGLCHDRSGDLVVVADKESWFTYYFWEDDSKAPDYARMVDIHKKPGYDPVEMLTHPKDKLVMLKVLFKLIKKKLGFRSVMDIIPLEAELIKGSHGRIPENDDDWPVLITNENNLLNSNKIEATEVFSILKQHVKP
ncbi:MAG: alkaline phosphatase family protein [Croceivirga sp.]